MEFMVIQLNSMSNGRNGNNRVLFYGQNRDNQGSCQKSFYLKLRFG